MKPPFYAIAQLTLIVGFNGKLLKPSAKIVTGKPYIWVYLMAKMSHWVVVLKFHPNIHTKAFVTSPPVVLQPEANITIMKHSIFKLLSSKQQTNYTIRWSGGTNGLLTKISIPAI